MRSNLAIHAVLLSSFATVAVAQNVTVPAALAGVEGGAQAVLRGAVVRGGARLRGQSSALTPALTPGRYPRLRRMKPQ